MNIIKKIWKIMLYILGIIVLLITVAILFTKFAPVFWWVVEWKRLDIIKKLEYFKNGKFENISGIKASIQKQEWAKDSGGIKDFLFPKKWKIPTQALPSKKFDAKKFNEGDFVWFGHSTILFRTDGKNILTDPVFNRASPIPIFWKEFEVENKTQKKELPKIDAIIISHDQYEHVDY
jgi:hypothetical protein